MNDTNDKQKTITRYASLDELACDYDIVAAVAEHHNVETVAASTADDTAVEWDY